MAVIEFLGPYALQHFVMLAVIIGMGMIISINFGMSKPLNRNVFAGLMMVLLLSLVSYTDTTYLGQRHTYQPMRLVCSVLGYSLRPAIILTIIRLVVKKRKLFMIYTGLVVLNALVYFSAFFTPLVVSFTPQNGFVPHPLRFTCAFVAAILLVALAFSTIERYKADQVEEAGLIIFICIITLGASLLESQLLNDSVLSCTVMSISFMLYYMFVHIQNTRKDHVTGLLNRQCFFDYCLRNRHRISAVISMDMNELKWINDTAGHEAGDIALKELAQCLQITDTQQTSVYRIGGDEFCKVCLGMNEAQVKEHVEKIRAAISATPYSCAVGYAMKQHEFDERYTFDLLCSEADASMYRNKLQMKRAMAERGEVLHLRENQLSYFRSSAK